MRRLLLASLLLLFGWAAPVQAQVVATFYSHDLDDHFPHAFFTLKGKTVAGGEEVDTNYGFTAKSITPAILFGPVKGRIDIAKPGYVEHSKPHFSLTLSDDQYRAILEVVEKWRTAADPSYNMNSANCVYFVGEAAQAIGLAVAFPKKLMKKPRSYLEEIRRLNPGLNDLWYVERKPREAAGGAQR